MAAEAHAPDEVVLGARVVGHDLGDAGFGHEPGADEHVLLEAAATDRADALPGGREQQPRARPAVRRPLDRNQGGEHCAADGIGGEFADDGGEFLHGIGEFLTTDYTDYTDRVRGDCF